MLWKAMNVCIAYVLCIDILVVRVCCQLRHEYEMDI